jgi:HPt (histidine-containing phosphotransfer) domain-containing protein
VEVFLISLHQVKPHLGKVVLQTDYLQNYLYREFETFKESRWSDMSNQNNTLIHSTLAGDEDFSDLLSEFVKGLASRQQSLREYLQNRDEQRLTRLIHQLKGACGGYGFSSLTDAAGKIEDQLRGGCSLDELVTQIESFIDTLSLVTSAPA